MSTTQEMLDERYGRRRSPAARAVTIVVAVLVGIGVAAFAWMIVSSSANSVEADTTGFTIVDARSVELDFQFTAPAGSTVACALEAQDVEHAVVGWKVVEIPASDGHAQAFHEAIPTIAAATTGFVNSCWVT